MSTRKWQGWRRPGSNITLHIGPLPTRKAIALYSMVGSVMYVHAYFRDETEARRALSVIEFITGGDPLEPGIWLGDDALEAS
jgi:hypothetical protein